VVEDVRREQSTNCEKEGKAYLSSLISEAESSSVWDWQLLSNRCANRLLIGK